MERGHPARLSTEERLRRRAERISALRRRYAGSSHRMAANRERSRAEKLPEYLKKKIEDDEKRK